MKRLLVSECSLEVDSEDDAGAKEGLILVGVARVVVVLHIPKALGGDADTLALDFADDGLHHNFVTIVFEGLHLSLDLAHDLLSPAFGGSVVVLLILQVHLHDFLDDLLHFRWVESIAVHCR